MINIRYATPDDLESWQERLPPRRSYLWAAEIDGDVIAIGGYSILVDGSALVHLSTDGDIQRQHKFALCRMAGTVIEAIRAKGYPVIVAEHDDDVPGSEKFLEWLGFEKDRDIWVYRGT